MNAHRAILSAVIGFACFGVGSLQAQTTPAPAQPATAAGPQGVTAEPTPVAEPSATPAPVPTSDPGATAPAAAPAPAPAAVAAPSAPTAPTGGQVAAQAALDTEQPPDAEEPEARKVGNPKFGKPSDHDDVVGRWAIAYFGVQGVPIADAADPDEKVATPVLGARHWFNDTLGLEAGIGFGYEITGGNTFAEGEDDVNLPQTGVFAFSLHTGLPLSIYDAGHFNALIIPEVNLGFANGLKEAGKSASGLDEFPSGFSFSAGARAGAEIHLDFIGVPQVVLQLTVGFQLQYVTRTLESEGTGGTAPGRTEGAVTIASDATSPKDWLAAGLQVLWYL